MRSLTATALLATNLLLGCVKPATIRGDGLTVQAPQYGESASLDTERTTTKATIPAGTVYRSQCNPPYYKDHQWVFPSPFEIAMESTRTIANTGTINTKVAEKEVDAKAKQPFLHGVMAAIALGVIFVWRGYPTPAILCGVAAAILFACWRLADLPTWVWGVSVAVVALSAGIYFGYERKEKET